MNSNITVQYHTDETILTDYHATFVPNIGDCIILGNKRYRVNKIDHLGNVMLHHAIETWEIRVFLEKVNSDNIE